MAIIRGQIESLKRLRSELQKQGISRFNSVKEIQHFLKNYNEQENQVPQDVANDIDEEITVLMSIRNRLEEEHKNDILFEQKELSSKIKKLEDRIKKLKKSRSNFIWDTINGLKLWNVRSKREKFQRDFNHIIEMKTSLSRNKFENANQKLLEHTKSRPQVIAHRTYLKLDELRRIKKVINNLYPLIAGAIGENQVVNELKKLSNDYLLINDFSVDFNPPIYNKREKDRIYSIQIDHLLVSPSGIFLIETKNWSRKSIESYDLRSPVSQIRRTSYALFVILNSNSNKYKVKLESHHWGVKKIPIRNMIAMTNQKPKEKFKHVAIKSTEELIGYLSYFEPIFSKDEVLNIGLYLEQIMNKQ